MYCTPGADGSQSVRATRPGRAVGGRCDRPRKPDHIGPAPYWDLVALLDLLLDIGDSTGPGDISPDDLHRFENYAKTALTNRP